MYSQVSPPTLLLVKIYSADTTIEKIRNNDMNEAICEFLNQLRGFICNIN